MSILIKIVRVAGFRGLENIEVELEKTTVLTGMNNTGKTSFLKALQIALGSRQFITQDDFFIMNNTATKKIVIDIYILPVNETENEIDEFSNEWERLFTTNRIQNDGANSFIPLRTIVSFDQVKNSYKTEQYILKSWPIFQEEDVFWHASENGTKIGFNFDELPFFYINAQRDILEDTKLRNSYLGRMLSKIEYSEEDILQIEQQIKKLNEQTVNSSSILSILKTTLKELNATMNSNSEGIEITPFTKKIRDLNKGLTIYYSDSHDSFSMEYHGMGTRSWSSLLTLKSFISLLAKKSDQEGSVFFPILAIEEPEAHLHPNAQKKLFSQMNSICGQKIISTHSPYIASTATLNQIRSFYKNDRVHCGKIETNTLTPEEVRKINRQVISSRGEIFFSRILILFEGETEEQALPIFAKKYFEESPIELGIDFVGVGGYGGYLPFLMFAESLHIPWFIFSDGEAEAIKAVKNAIKKLRNIDDIDLSGCNNVFILEESADFEKYLINNDYIEEIKNALKDLHSEEYLEKKILELDGKALKRTRTIKICSLCKQNIYKNLPRNYNGDEGFKRALYDIVTSQKTQIGPVIADQIVKSDKGLPPKVSELFDNVKLSLES